VRSGTQSGSASTPAPVEVGRQVIALGRGLGADLEAYVQSGRTVTIKVYGREVESVSVAEPRGVGLRAVRDGRTGYAFSTDVTQDGLRRVVAEAESDMSAADSDPFAGLPAGATEPYADLPGLWRAGASLLPLEEKIAMALEAEAAALAATGVDTVEESVYSDEEARVAVVSSCGVEAEAEQSYSFVYVVAHAGAGTERQSGLGFSSHRDPRDLEPESAGREAAEKALALVGARPCPTGAYTVVLDREVAAALLSTLVGALGAEAVQKGRSVFAGRLGEMVGSDVITLVDDGLDLDGMATSPFDGEGVPQQVTTLVERGMLRSFLFDSRSARREGRATGSTGNARRASYRSLPRVGPSNLAVTPGSGTLEELLQRVGDGLYVESIAGLHSGVNPMSGEISLGVSGRLIKAGSSAAPVREVTMATDFAGLLGGISDLGGDARWIPLHGSVRTPSMAVLEVTVSGA
jgi:PmbA protein